MQWQNPYLPPKGATIGWLFLILVEDDFSHFTLYGDMARCRVLDRSDVTLDSCVEGAVFEKKVGIFTKCAVLKDQAIDIAEKLFARQVATHQANVLAIPCQVLTIDFSQKASFELMTALWISTLRAYWKE